MFRSAKLSKDQDLVILVHGWGGHALIMSYLARRLRKAGYRTLSLSYPSLTHSLENNIEKIQDKLQDTHKNPAARSNRDTLKFLGESSPNRESPNRDTLKFLGESSQSSQSSLQDTHEISRGAIPKSMGVWDSVRHFMGVSKFRFFSKFRFWQQNVGVLNGVQEMGSGLGPGREPVVHFVGHSLGGIVLLRALQRIEVSPSSRLVLMGVPIGGCTMGARARRSGYTGWLVKNLVELEDVAPLRIDSFGQNPQRKSIGVIAGNSGFSLTGQFFGGTQQGDGVVELAETFLEGSQRCEIPCSHTRMIFSGKVADELVHFLQFGSFSVDNATM